jgi:hypothetical protein
MSWLHWIKLQILIHIYDSLHDVQKFQQKFISVCFTRIFAAIWREMVHAQEWFCSISCQKVYKLEHCAEIKLVTCFFCWFLWPESLILIYGGRFGLLPTPPRRGAPGYHRASPQVYQRAAVFSDWCQATHLSMTVTTANNHCRPTFFWIGKESCRSKRFSHIDRRAAREPKEQHKRNLANKHSVLLIEQNLIPFIKFLYCI